MSEFPPLREQSVKLLAHSTWLMLNPTLLLRVWLLMTCQAEWKPTPAAISGTIPPGACQAGSIALGLSPGELVAGESSVSLESGKLGLVHSRIHLMLFCCGCALALSVSVTDQCCELPCPSMLGFVRTCQSFILGVVLEIL